jgi:hypothetical protein
MAKVQGQDHKSARLRNRGNSDIGEARMATVGLSCVAERAGNPRRGKVKGQKAISIVVEDPIEPSAQIIGSPARAGSAQFGDARLDLGSTDRRQIQRFGPGSKPSG